MHRKCGRSDTLAFANKQWVREYNAQFLNRLTDCRGGQIKHFRCINDPFMYIYSFKNSQKVKINIS
ncbi:Uncharacterised protein [Shigella sonnei]|nr:Uncharacterised protein [Shigella sonnei]